MKKINILGIVFLMLLLIFSVSACKKEPIKHKVNLIVRTDFLSLEVEDGSTFIHPGVEVDGYVFVGWYDANNNKIDSIVVDKNITLTGKYIKAGTKYNISYILNGGEMPEEYPTEYVVGTKTQLVNPNGFGKMQFIGWYVNEEEVTDISEQTFGNIELVAKWIDENVYHTLEYHLDGGRIDESYKERYIEGSSYKLPIPKKDGHLFKGWYTDALYQNRIKTITKEDTSDYKLYAKFVENTKENIYISFLGDSITTYAGYIPEGFATYYPTGGCDVDSVEKTWWYQLVEKTGYNLLMNNSYSGSFVSSGANLGNSYDRLKYLEKDGIDPDIIVINMGTNDLTHGVGVEKFKSAYQSMINKIKEEYDDVEIYVCNLPYNKYGINFVKTREKYNVALEELCLENNLELIDLTEAITLNNVHLMMFAGAHPSYEGMCVIAEEAWKKMK